MPFPGAYSINGFLRHLVIFRSTTIKTCTPRGV